MRFILDHYQYEKILTNLTIPIVPMGVPFSLFAFPSKILDFVDLYMFKILVVSTAATLIGAATQPTTIRIPRDTNRFPVEYRSLHDDSRFEGIGAFEIGSSDSYFTSHHRAPVASGSTQNGQTYPQAIQARGISISDGQLDIDFDHPIPVVNESASVANWDNVIHISGCYRSALAQSISGFLMTPVSETEDMLILNPTNVSEYAYEGQIFYTRHIPADPNGRHAWRVHTAVLIVPHSSSGGDEVMMNRRNAIYDEEFVPCKISKDFHRSLVIPHGAFGRLVSLIEQMGVPVSTRGIEVFLDDVSDEQLAQLPSIEYYIMATTGREIHIGEIHPAQYVTAATGDHPGRYRLTIYGALPQNRQLCTMDSRVWKNLLMHFDVQNDRIGFGEPLVEL